MTTTVN